KFLILCKYANGDILCIINGSANTIVIVEITKILEQHDYSSMQIVLNILLPSQIAAITVGGKAFGKHLDIHSSTSIILLAGKFLFFMDHYVYIQIVQRRIVTPNK